MDKDERDRIASGDMDIDMGNSAITPDGKYIAIDTHEREISDIVEVLEEYCTFALTSGEAFPIVVNSDCVRPIAEAILSKLKGSDEETK